MIRKLLDYKTPQNLIMLINIMAALLLSIRGGGFDRFVLGFGLLLAVILYASNFILLRVSGGDHYIFMISSMLIVIGVIMIYRIDPQYGIRQVTWLAAGIFAYFTSYVLVKKIKGWRNWTKQYMIVSFVLFVATLALGVRIKGATNWIRVGGFTIQPTEITKIVFVFFMASYYCKKERFMNSYCLVASVYAFIGFLFLQRDLGTAMIFYFVFMTIFYIFETDRKLIYYNIAAAAAIAFASYFVVGHVEVRVSAWIDPWKYADSRGYQIVQSMIAIASGGFFGTGIGFGYPQSIPEVHTDFIFSAICEEMGIFGGIGVIMLFMILTYRGFKIALSQQDSFFKTIALGITSMIGFQAFVIIGGVTNMIPLTGVTLPFVSYGGSSLVSSLDALGILQVASEKVGGGAEGEVCNG